MAEGGFRRKLVAAGCLIPVFLLLGALVMVSVLAWRSYRDHLLYVGDPEARTAQALEILGGGLPDGYHAMAAMTMAGMLRAVVLSDSPPGDDGRIDRFETGLFLYLESRGEEITPDDLLNIWPGDLGLEPGDRLRKGTIRHTGVEIDYTSARGILINGHRRHHGVFAELSFRCAAGGRKRAAIWFQTVPVGSPVNPMPSFTALLGGPADPSAVRRFTASMDLCRE
jgi:hypothetical protein